MEWNMTPMAHNAGARLVPIAPPIAGEVIPVERLVVEVAHGPFWHAAKHVPL